MAWVTRGLLFSVVIAIGFGSQAFGEYISGYLIEKSLSVDNVFVWAMLFASLSIQGARPRTLTSSGSHERYRAHAAHSNARQ